MKFIRRGIQIVLTIALSACLLHAQQPLPITRVLLAKNGMAYIVRSGQIGAPVSLTFHPEDMNDVLKSFTAWNPDSGALYSVGYTTGIPSSHMLGRFPFNLTNSDLGLGDFLTQVKGAAVRLDLGAKPLEGKLLAAQKTDHVLQQQTSTADYRLTVLLAEGSIQTAWLSEVRSVEFPDPALRNQLKEYLEVLAEGRQDVTRQVSIYPPASQGPGPVRVAYLQQFPLWKTSYRMDLGSKESAIQGWAQIDNPTGESWDNVEVSLLSGSPVSFVMNLYQPLYTNRATVAVPGGQVAGPRQYESAVREGLPLTGNDPLALIATLPGYRANAQGREYDTAGGLAAKQMREMTQNVGIILDEEQLTGLPMLATASTLLTTPPTLTTELRDFFEFRFPFPVRLGSRQSALLPFVQKTTPTERLSIFNAAADRGNPRLGVRIQNNTDVPFEPGPVTFFEEGRYAGEAVMTYLPRTEKRLVSYGVDYDIQISSKPKSQPETRVRMTAAHGVVTLYTERLQTTTYEIRNKGTAAKTLIVEHPRQGDRKLKDMEAWETTDSYYRFRVDLKPGEMTELTPTEIVSRAATVTLTNLNRGQFAALFSGNDTPQALKGKLGQILEAQEKVAALTKERVDTEAQSNALFRDQERLRENLKALRDTREDQSLRSRYLEQLSKEEDQLKTWRERLDTLQKDIAAGETRRAELIENLAWE